MRMWMVIPKIMCHQHLCGEHGEFHKFEGAFIEQQNMDNRIYKRQIFPYLMKARHDQLADEMIRRDYNHNSPYTMPDISYIKLQIEFKSEDIAGNLYDLINRCDKCYKRYIKEKVE